MQPQKSTGTKKTFSPKSLFVSCFILSVLFGVLANYFFFTPRIAYINTGKLLIGFSESNKLEKELKAENDKWQTQLKELEDSIQTQVNAMSKEYNGAAPARKKELQDMLSAKNQQANNFRQANARRMDEMRQKKMQTVFDKANIFIAEYGKKHRYGIILGTVAGGSILFGDERKYDITEEIVKGLNERYK
jgi:outer membrane protein